MEDYIAILILNPSLPYLRISERVFGNGGRQPFQLKELGILHRFKSPERWNLF